MVEVLLGRRLERGHTAGERVDAGEDAPDRAVFPRRVEPLEHEQDGARALRPEARLELAQLVTEPLGELLGLPLPAQSQPIARVALGQQRRLARRHEDVLDQAHAGGPSG